MILLKKSTEVITFQKTLVHMKELIEEFSLYLLKKIKNFFSLNNF